MRAIFFMKLEYFSKIIVLKTFEEPLIGKEYQNYAIYDFCFTFIHDITILQILK